MQHGVRLPWYKIHIVLLQHCRGDENHFGHCAGLADADARACAERKVSAGGNFIDVDGGTSFPDYVFEPDYQLMPLTELASYLEREKHLPNPGTPGI